MFYTHTHPNLSLLSACSFWIALQCDMVGQLSNMSTIHFLFSSIYSRSVLLGQDTKCTISVIPTSTAKPSVLGFNMITLALREGHTDPPGLNTVCSKYLWFPSLLPSSSPPPHWSRYSSYNKCAPKKIDCGIKRWAGNKPKFLNLKPKFQREVLGFTRQEGEKFIPD